MLSIFLILQQGNRGKKVIFVLNIELLSLLICKLAVHLFLLQKHLHNSWALFLDWVNVYFLLSAINLPFTPLLPMILIRQTTSVWLFHLLLCSVLHLIVTDFSMLTLAVFSSCHVLNAIEIINFLGQRLLFACCFSVQAAYLTKIFDCYF